MGGGFRRRPSHSESAAQLNRHIAQRLLMDAKKPIVISVFGLSTRAVNARAGPLAGPYLVTPKGRQT